MNIKYLCEFKPKFDENILAVGKSINEAFYKVNSLASDSSLTYEDCYFYEIKEIAIECTMAMAGYI